MNKFLNNKFKKRKDEKDFWYNMNNDFYDLSVCPFELTIILDSYVIKKGIYINDFNDIEMFLRYGISKRIINDVVCSSVLKLPYKRYQLSNYSDEEDSEDDNEVSEDDSEDSFNLKIHLLLISH